MPGYTVGAGDSASSVAGKVYGDQRMFAALKRLNPGIWYPGRKLVLPGKEDNPFVSQAEFNAAKAGTGVAGANARAAEAANLSRIAMATSLDMSPDARQERNDAEYRAAVGWKKQQTMEQHRRLEAQDYAASTEKGTRIQDMAQRMGITIDDAIAKYRASQSKTQPGTTYTPRPDLEGVPGRVDSTIDQEGFIVNRPGQPIGIRPDSPLAKLIEAWPSIRMANAGLGFNDRAQLYQRLLNARPEDRTWLMSGVSGMSLTREERQQLMTDEGIRRATAALVAQRDEFAKTAQGLPTSAEVAAGRMNDRAQVVQEYRNFQMREWAKRNQNYLRVAHGNVASQMESMLELQANGEYEAASNTMPEMLSPGDVDMLWGWADATRSRAYYDKAVERWEAAGRVGEPPAQPRPNKELAAFIENNGITNVVEFAHALGYSWDQGARLGQGMWMKDTGVAAPIAGWGFAPQAPRRRGRGGGGGSAGRGMQQVDSWNWAIRIT